jgi:hypothetical protein
MLNTIPTTYLRPHASYTLPPPLLSLPPQSPPPTHRVRSLVHSAGRRRGRRESYAGQQMRPPADLLQAVGPSSSDGDGAVNVSRRGSGRRGECVEASSPAAAAAASRSRRVPRRPPLLCPLFGEMMPAPAGAGEGGGGAQAAPRRRGAWRRGTGGAWQMGLGAVSGSGGGRLRRRRPLPPSSSPWPSRGAVVADGALGRGPRATSARLGRLEARWIWRPGGRTGRWRPTCRPPVQPKKRQKRPAGRFGGPFQAPGADSLRA